MKFSRPRFTVRRMMILVAATGLALGSWAWMARRSAAFQARAAAHSGRVREVEMPCRVNQPLREHHDALVRKYTFAARHPWLPVSPDPPEPE